MFNRLPFGLETFIYTLIPDKLIIYFLLVTVASVILLWRYKCYVLLACYYSLLLCQTVVFRHESESMELRIVPFRKVANILDGNAETCWEIGLKIVVFIPIGILLTLILGRDKWRKSIAIGIILSMTVELLQLFLRRGLCESDDILVNTLGCCLGVWMVLIAKHIFISNR